MAVEMAVVVVATTVVGARARVECGESWGRLRGKTQCERARGGGCEQEKWRENKTGKHTHLQQANMSVLESPWRESWSK